MSRWHVLAIAAVPVLLGLMRPAPGPELVWWTTHGIAKVHPYDPAPSPPPHSVKLQAARNEFEPFQVILRAESRDIDGVDVTVTDLRGPNSVIPQTSVFVYLERYINLAKPSSIDGGSGEWPDAVVPRIDRYTHEKRNAFPVKLLRSRNQPIWVEVFVPTGTSPGMYHGEVHVMASGKLEASIPLDLEVWNFDLPSTSSLVTTFGFSGLTAVREHYKKYTGDASVNDITTLYGKSALSHRITLDGSAGVLPQVN